jgi:PAS domain S-box-containing protein
MSLINTETVLHNFIHLDSRPYFVLNLNTRTFEYANPAFCEYFQVKQGSLKADKILKMIDKEERSRFEKTLCALTPGVPHGQLECKIKSPDGTERFLALHLVLEKQDEQSSLTGFIEDVTALKVNEAQFKEQAAVRDKQRRALKHDLSGTLGFIPTFTALLLKKTEELEDKQVPVLISSIESISKETLSKIKDYMNEERN